MPRVPWMMAMYGVCCQTVAVAGWIVALALIFLVVFITHEKFKEDGQPWTKSQDAAYDTLSRSAWALCLVWIIFSCHMGYGGQCSCCAWYILSSLKSAGYVQCMQGRHAAYANK